MTAGSTRCVSEPAPPTGSQLSHSEKTTISTRPVQKIGIDSPKSEPSRASASKSEFGHTAEATPAAMPATSGEEQRGHRQLQRRRPGVGQLGGHRTVLLDRAPEVAARDAADVVEVADEEGLVEAEVLAQPGHRVLGGVLAEHERDGVAGQQIDGEHDHEHHAEQDGHGEEEAADDERQHPPPPATHDYLSIQVFERVRLYSTGWIWKPFTPARVTMISFVV